MVKGVFLLSVLTAALLLLGCGGGSGHTEAAPAPEPPASPASIDGAYLDNLLASLVASEANAITGIQLAVVVDQVVVYSASAGLARIESAQAMTTQHQIRVASLSKLITALAVAVAVERGLMRWNQPVEDFLDFNLRHPNWPDYAPTLAYFIGHASGLSGSGGYLIADNASLRDWYFQTAEAHMLQVLFERAPGSFPVNLMAARIMRNAHEPFYTRYFYARVKAPVHSTALESEADNAIADSQSWGVTH